MNNKGQTLVFFVALIPIVLILFAFIFDSAYITMQNNKLNDLAKLSVKYIVKDNQEFDKVQRIIKKNDKDIIIVNVSNNSVHLKKDIDPIFGKIVGYEKYHLEANVYGIIKENKLIIKEKGK